MTLTNNISNYFTQGNTSLNGQYIIPPLNIGTVDSTALQNPLFSFSNTNISTLPTFNFAQSQTFSPFGNLDNFMIQMPDYTQMFSNLITMYNNTIANFPKMDISKMFSPIQTNYSDADTTNFSYDADELKKRWSQKKPNLSDEFYNKVVQIAKRLNCNPDDLMAVMNAESGLNPAAKNQKSSATGLIQFIESTAKSLGTTTAELKKMSAEQQLVYVEKYLQREKKAAKLNANQKITASDLYAMVFLPSKVGENVIATSADHYYNAGDNKHMDLNHDGVITNEELGQRVQNFKV